MGKQEAAVENYLRKQANRKGYLCWKFISPQNNGVPDRILIGHNQLVFVETKAPKGHLRDLQLYQHRILREHGAYVYTTTSKNDVDNLFCELENMQDKRCSP